MSDSVFPRPPEFHPAIGAQDPRSGSYGAASIGVTKRELFAGMAMQAILASAQKIPPQVTTWQLAVHAADELLAELAK